jgi:hypothetical protein
MIPSSTRLFKYLMDRAWTRHPRSRTFCTSRVARWRRILHCGFRLRKKSTVVWPAQSTAPYRYTPLSMNRYIGLVHPLPKVGAPTARCWTTNFIDLPAMSFRKIPWRIWRVSQDDWHPARGLLTHASLRRLPIDDRRFPTSPEPELTHSGKLRVKRTRCLDTRV